MGIKGVSHLSRAKQCWRRRPHLFVYKATAFPQVEREEAIQRSFLQQLRYLFFVSLPHLYVAARGISVRIPLIALSDPNEFAVLKIHNGPALFNSQYYRDS